MLKEQISIEEAVAMFNVDVMKNIEDAWPTFSRIASDMFKADFSKDSEALMKVVASVIGVGMAYSKKGLDTLRWDRLNRAMIKNLTVDVKGCETILADIYASVLENALQIIEKGLAKEKEAEMMGRVVHHHFTHKSLMKIDNYCDTSPLTDMFFAGCCIPFAGWWLKFFENYQISD